MTQPNQPPNVTSTAPAVITAGSTPLLTEEEREYYTIRWRVLLLELRYLADKLGWADRLPTKKI